MLLQGPKERAEIVCKSCGAESTLQRANLRAVTFPKSPEDAVAAGKPVKGNQPKKQQA